jgi:hypothetical protein
MQSPACAQEIDRETGPAAAGEMRFGKTNPISLAVDRRIGRTNPPNEQAGLTSPVSPSVLVNVAFGPAGVGLDRARIDRVRIGCTRLENRRVHARTDRGPDRQLLGRGRHHLHRG